MSALRDFFTSALAEGKNQLDEQRKSRLELTMLSKKIEMEIEQRRQQEINTQEIQSYAPGELNPALRTMGFTEAQLDPLTGKPLRKEAGDALLGMGKGVSIASARASMSGRRPMIRSVGNSVVSVSYDQRGRPVIDQVLGLTPQAQGKVSTALSDFSASEKTLTQMEDELDELFTATGGFEAFVKQYPGMSFQQIAQRNPTARVYFDLLPTRATDLRRAIEGNSRLTDVDVKTMIESLPNKSDTAEVALEKLNKIRDIFEARKDSIVRAYKDPVGLEQEQAKEKKARDAAKKTSGPKSMSSEELRRIAGF